MDDYVVERYDWSCMPEWWRTERYFECLKEIKQLKEELKRGKKDE